MKNGDVLDGDPGSFFYGLVRVSSVELGITTYNQNGADVRACVVRAVHALPAAYEFRLRDGSIINVSDFEVKGDVIALHEIGGLTIDVTTDEIAQLRAGSAQAQSLTELGWKATPPEHAAPAINPASATNAPPATDTAPAPAAGNAASPASTVQTWEGPNQEEIILAPLATPLEFTLPGKFRAIGVHVALSPDSPPNSNLTIRVLANGKEIARTPPFKAGEQPRFMQVMVQDPRTVTLEADSIFTGARALLIDPVAIRDKER
jgi:hypothetical protein